MTLPTSFPADPAPIASTSKGPEDRTANNPGPDSPGPRQRLLDQREFLDRLAEGEGIPLDEWDGLFEKCYMCKRFMLEAAFKAHSRKCWDTISDSEPEDESDVDEWGKE